jgi:RNA polymerase primary sigma factor
MKRLLAEEMANRGAVSRQTRTDPAAHSEEASMKKHTTTPDDLFDADHAHDHADDEPAGHIGGADDALGLYLKQMGAIPLLNRDKELCLAKKLEKSRERYRRAVLFCWWSQQRLIAVFERIRVGVMPIDPQIDVVHSLKLERDSILARLPHNLRTLGKLLKGASKDFAAYLRLPVWLSSGEVPSRRARRKIRRPSS